jgi:zinc protease
MSSSLLLAVPAPICGVQAQAAAAVPAFAVQKTTLANGLDVILVEDHKLPLVAVNLWYHVGPANEAPGLTGFAHLFEHMMFAATKHAPRGLVDTLLEGAGATDSNGSTDFDRTNYHDTVPSNQLELALWAHADRMGYLLDVLDQNALANQQDVVRNERRENVENRPYGIVEEALFQQLFPVDHPYHANIIGSHADIQSASLADVREFFIRYYCPNNASIVIAGDIDKAATLALVEKYFGSFKRGLDVAPPQVRTPAITAERRVVVADRIELPRVIMGWLTMPAYQPGDADLSIASHILAGGKASRLYKSLVYEQQLAQDVNAVQHGYALSSVFEVDVTARPGVSADQLEAAIDAELAALRTHGPTLQEVEQAQHAIETAMLASVEKIGGEGLADMINEYNQYVGDPDYFGRDLERYRAVTPASVQRVLAEQLGNHARVIIHGVPGTPVLPPEVPVTRKRASSARQAPVNGAQDWRHAVPRPGPAPRIDLPVPRAFTLANGFTVLHHHNPALPLVAAELVIKAGASANPPDHPGLASFTLAVLDEGTGSRSALVIADELAQLGASFGASCGNETTRLSLLALKKNFARALDIVADVARDPAFPEQEVERQRTSRLADLAQLHEDAGAVADVVAAALLYGPGHPFGHGELGSESALKATTRADLLAFWRTHYQPGNAALVLSGDLTADEALALAEASFGQWQAGAPSARLAPEPVTFPGGLVLVPKDDASQSALQLTMIGAARTSPDFAALEVMNAALGGLFTSRINTNLREEKGYSYGVFSQFDYRATPGPFEVVGSVRANATGASIAEILKEIKAIRDTPLPAAELDNARNAQILSLPGHFDTNEGISASLAGLFAYQLPLDYYNTVAQQFHSVTAAQVQAVAKSYLQPDRLIMIAVGDRKKLAPQLRKLDLGPITLLDTNGQAL